MYYLHETVERIYPNCKACGVDYEKFGCPQLSLEIKNIWKMVQDTLNPSPPPHLSLASKNEGIYPLENKIGNFPLPSQRTRARTHTIFQ